ncbi:ribulose-phosphate 3-epimerase [Candidatus Woesearchaeota archaeon]|nr:ribulose-phosphate 3-epimerase [Candidatus Woesearchaeota archaeon]MBW3016310.1 ribulose-phosphate 3-epimerase [Candidatus Woesearchaeota archaeon]
MEIRPGILVHTLKELKEALSRLSWAKKVHLDIMDGKFVRNKTIQAQTLKKALPNPRERSSLGPENADIFLGMEFGVHLMAYKPHKYIKTYARLGAKELIIHQEATKKLVETLEEIRLNGMKAGIAFNPETKVDKHALIHADTALIMTVHPGYSGQTMMKAPLRKIAEIRKCNPIISIGVDGGINLKTCRLAAKADWAVASSAVTDAPDPKKAYKELIKRCK